VDSFSLSFNMEMPNQGYLGGKVKNKERQRKDKKKKRKEEFFYNLFKNNVKYYLEA